MSAIVLLFFKKVEKKSAKAVFKLDMDQQENRTFKLINPSLNPLCVCVSGGKKC